MFNFTMASQRKFLGNHSNKISDPSSDNYLSLDVVSAKNYKVRSFENVGERLMPARKISTFFKPTFI